MRKTGRKNESHRLAVSITEISIGLRARFGCAYLSDIAVAIEEQPRDRIPLVAFMMDHLGFLELWFARVLGSSCQSLEASRRDLTSS